jgi:hypothetical protein
MSRQTAALPILEDGGRSDLVRKFSRWAAAALLETARAWMVGGMVMTGATAALRRKGWGGSVMKHRYLRSLFANERRRSAVCIGSCINSQSLAEFESTRCRLLCRAWRPQLRSCALLHSYAGSSRQIRHANGGSEAAVDETYVRTDACALRRGSLRSIGSIPGRFWPAARRVI